MRIESVDAALGVSNAVNSIPAAGAWDPEAMLVMTGTGRSWALTPEQLAAGLGASSLQAVSAVAGTRSAARRSRLQALTSSAGILDLHAVVRMLRVGQNKLRILRLLMRSDWIKILYLLPKALLVNALRLFSKTKLLRLIMMLPKRLLLKMLLRIFKLEELIKKMPTAELMRILRSRKLNNRELLKGLMNMDPQFLLLLMQRIYGDYEFLNLKRYDLAKIIMQTSKERLLEAFKTMPFKALQPLVTEFVKKDPELLMNISDAFIFKLMDKVTKPTLMMACMVLPEDMLIKMLCQLPNNQLMLAAAQIDDKTFEQYLISQHPALLAMLAGAA